MKQKVFRGESSYETYLYRMTVNRCHDYFRNWSFKNLFYTNETFYKAENVSSAETEAMGNIETVLLWEQLQTLPLKYREVLILHYYEELNIEKIANLLSISPNTVKTRLRRAKNRLKDTLRKVGEVNG